ncbi:hypothetical protein MM35RIKEN_06790 [Vescimonas fastidiosa]|uniref:Uncharacterized protein n=1 Tax=Vescimonas fastidiosa TaxID=2714353 RepID=A0A810PWL5_9FIRM|nr:hypothetical protein [Vescimonas fastidiosa]BCK78487.1 hypothetical protein MM35RIKEN_06790 [Vescimonas fastidiosa]
MRLRKKKLPAALWAVLVLALSATLVLAAYYGKGNFKDVFVNRKHSFSSDVLSSVSRFEEADKNVVRPQGMAAKSISFYNYDRSTGEYNDFDVTFSVYAWLDKDDTGRAYTISYGTTTGKTVNSTTHDTPIFTATLKGKKASELAITVQFNANANEDLTTFPKLLMVAVPDTPRYMASRMLGACIVPSRSEGFHVDCGFEKTEGNVDIEDYAAFIYGISMVGEPPKNGVLRVLWRSDRLTLMEHNDFKARNVENPTDGFDKYIYIPQETDYYGRLSFMRVQGIEDEKNNPWKNNSYNWTDLESFVKWQQLP